MADIFIYNLTTIGSIDPSNDWMIIEDTSVGETKKAAPGQLPISTATQAALDTKVDENASIVAATKTKITYDAKGLVTAGADLSASDIPTGINAANISSGLISNAEFDYLNGLTDNIQTQFNGKQQTLTLTTTGTSGAATLVGGTLNIPQYSGGGGGGVSQIVAGTNVTISPAGGTGVVTINATGGGGGGGGTVTNVSALTLGTTGTDLSSTVANSTTTPVITLNVPTASASNRGALSASDWSTFNGKVPYTGATSDLNLGTKNLTANAVFDGFTSSAASGTQIVLTITSTPNYTITGSGGQVIKLPDATTLPNGAVYYFNNNQSSGAISVNNNSNTLVASIPSGGFTAVTLLSNATAAGTWERHEQAPSNVSWSTNTFDYPGSITSATWNGVAIADARIASAATWNAKQQALSTVTSAQSLNGQVLQNFIPNLAGTSANLTLDSTNAATYNSSVIALTGALTITFDASLPNGFNVTLIQFNAATSTITGTGGLVIGNRQGHGKNNGQYSVVSIIKYTNVLAILGGDTSL